MAHELAELAGKAIKHYLGTGEKICPPPDSEFLKKKAGVFVSLKKEGDLRGCIGTFSPCCSNIAEETIQNAISAAVRDPRFPPVRPEELPAITYSVDVLSEPEPAEKDELDPKTYGVIVESGHKKGLLLPALEGVDSVSCQLEIAKRKACIMPGEPFKLYRFRVSRYR